MNDSIKYTGWLTDDNIQFILRHKDFWGSNWKDLKLNKDLNIVRSDSILLRTNTSATYLAYQYSKIPTNERNETEKNVLKRFKENWIKESEKINSTIFPITLGGHPGNHWGILVIEKEKNNFKTYWVDSIGGYENQIKPLVEYLTDTKTANSITPLDAPSRQKDGYNCGVFACFYIREMVEDDVVDELVNTTDNKHLKDFREKWSAEIGERWCKSGGFSEEDIGGWDWESIGISEEQSEQWFYGTDKPMGGKGLFFEQARDLRFAGFQAHEGEFANWAYQEYKKRKAQELEVEIINTLLDDLTPAVFAKSFEEASENLEYWREQYKNFKKPKEEEDKKSEKSEDDDYSPPPGESLSKEKIEHILKKTKNKKIFDNTHYFQVKDFRVYTDLNAIQKAFEDAKNDLDISDFVEKFPWDIPLSVVFPLQIKENCWGAFVIKNKKFWYISSNPNSGEEGKQLKPLVKKILGDKYFVKYIKLTPEQKHKKEQDCGIFIILYIWEMLETQYLFPKRTYTEQEINDFRKKWVGEKEQETDEEIIPDWLFPEETKKPTEPPLTPKTPKPPKPLEKKSNKCKICEKNTFYSRAEFFKAHGPRPKEEPSCWVYTSKIILKKPLTIMHVWLCRVCKQEYHTDKCKYYSPPPIKIIPPEIFDWENYWKWWFGVMTLDWDSKRFFGDL